MVHPEELLHERFLDEIEIAEGQVAFVELAIGHPVRHDPGDHAPDRGFITRREGSDRRLDPVGEHDQRGFPRLRLRSGMAVSANIDGLCGMLPGLGVEATVRFGGGFSRLGVEEADHRRPVVLRNEGDDRLGQACLIGDVDAVGNVGLEELGRLLRGQLIVQVLTAGLVLDEPDRVGQLADVVVIRRHARQQRIGPDGLRRPFGEISDHQRVVVGTGRLDQQAPQERLGGIGQFEELEHGEDPEHVSEDRERPDRGDRRASGTECGSGNQLDDPRQVALTEE